MGRRTLTVAVVAVLAGVACSRGGGEGERRKEAVGPAAGGAPAQGDLVFERELDGNLDLYVIPAGGGAERRLTDHPAEDGLPRWTPDGERVVFSSKRTGTWQLWEVPAEGGEPRRPGRIVERASVAALFAEPQHPYTIGLLGSVPKLHLEQERLAAIEGQVPSPLTPVTGCRFHPRCPFADEQCRRADPPLVDLGSGHEAACWKAPLAADAVPA